MADTVFFTFPVQTNTFHDAAFDVQLAALSVWKWDNVALEAAELLSLNTLDYVRNQPPSTPLKLKVKTGKTSVTSVPLSEELFSFVIGGCLDSKLMH